MPDNEKNSNSDSFSYSIVIRTLGNAGEKYKSLLDSIEAQTLKPDNIYVIIPFGYDLPAERTDKEIYVRTEKGMLHQRVFGIEYAEEHCNSKYLLMLDDDVAFDPDYAKTASMIFAQTGADMLTPTVRNKGEKSPKVKKVFSPQNIFALTGITMESHKSCYRVSIMRTAGHKTNTALIGSNPTQSCHGTGFWLRNGVGKLLDLSKEYWVQECKYALPDDQVLGYKAYISGLKIVSSRELSHEHLDAGTSVSGTKRYNLAFAKGRNFLIFWHRFIFKPEKKRVDRIKDRIAINYRLTSDFMVHLTYSLIKLDSRPIRGFISGLRDGRRYLRSMCYKSLPPIIKSNQLHNSVSDITS